MIFRWSIWGRHASKNIELLRYSIASFKKQFGSGHYYIVYTDDQEFVSKHLDNETHVKQFPSSKNSKFCIDSKATWAKWCPSARLDDTETEFYIDSDVFLLKYPHEIDSFLTDPKKKFAIMDEFLGQSWQHGAMQQKAGSEAPFVNAGLFIQKANFSIADELEQELDWWKQNIPPKDQTHHDEQGALAIALEPYFKKGELAVLPKDKYILIGPNENKDLENLEEITMFHAVYPDHPAFYKFRNYLDSLLAQDITPAQDNQHNDQPLAKEK